MFRENFETTITKLNIKRQSENDGSGLVCELTVCGRITDSQLIDLGSEVVALVESRSAGDTRILPFKTAELDQDWSDRLFTLYATPTSDEAKFSATDTKVRKFKLVKSEELPSKADLEMTIKLPPVKDSELLYLVKQIGYAVKLGITSSQTELDV